jgi:pyruvate kinase
MKEDQVTSEDRATDDISRLRELAGRLEVLRDEMRRRYVEAAGVFEGVHPTHQLSASNLIDYLTLRSFDLRDVQESLAELGLSSLGRAEEHVITTLERVIGNLQILAGDRTGFRTEAAVSFHEGRATLTANATNLLGESRPERPARILVTMPSEAAEDYALVAGLIESGMDCARVNCAHDGPPQWRAMIENIRVAAQAAGRSCPVLMDLPGPKLRTGPVSPGPQVLRLSPRRDHWGRVVEAAHALLVADDAPTSPARSDAATIPVPRSWLDTLEVGDHFDLVDTRGAHRRGEVESIASQGWRVRFADTTYLATGTMLMASGGRETFVGPLPEVSQALRLFEGDVVTLTCDLTPVSPQGSRIGCTLPEALDAVRVGDRVFFDDGKIGAVVLHCRSGEVDVQVTTAGVGGTKLREEKGINLPDTQLKLLALTDDDVQTLRFVVDNADLVGLSFVNRPEDVVALRRHLAELHGDDLGIVLKIETVHGFERLPDLLVAAMASERVGVMVARGDLAVECGFERLAEVQEEILWLCEAAHIPVIWATQVLDQMARTGQPSRAEISDAVMAGRAECVMLNKGPHVIDAVGALDSILRRMDSFQHKKTSLLRRLESWSPVTG